VLALRHALTQLTESVETQAAGWASGPSARSGSTVRVRATEIAETPFGFSDRRRARARAAAPEGTGVPRRAIGDRRGTL